MAEEEQRKLKNIRPGAWAASVTAGFADPSSYSETDSSWLNFPILSLSQPHTDLYMQNIWGSPEEQDTVHF